MLQKAPRNALLPCHSFPMDRHLSAAVDPRPADGLLGSGSSCTSMARHPPCTTSIRNSGRRLKCWLCPARHGTGKGRHASPAETVPQSAARFRQAFSGASLSGPAIAGPADVRPACRLAGSAVPAMAGTVYGAAYGQHGIVPGQGLALCRTLRRGVMLWAACAAFLGVRCRACRAGCRVSWRERAALVGVFPASLSAGRVACPTCLSAARCCAADWRHDVWCLRLQARHMVPPVGGTASGGGRGGIPNGMPQGTPGGVPAGTAGQPAGGIPAPPTGGASTGGPVFGDADGRPLRSARSGGTVYGADNSRHGMVPTIVGTISGGGLPARRWPGRGEMPPGLSAGRGARAAAGFSRRRGLAGGGCMERAPGEAPEGASGVACFSGRPAGRPVWRLLRQAQNRKKNGLGGGIGERRRSGRKYGPGGMRAWRGNADLEWRQGSMETGREERLVGRRKLWRGGLGGVDVNWHAADLERNGAVGS